MRSELRAVRGFTLLEVLAAVAILGIWYVILSTVAIQGLRAQGESHRRLEASFLADEVIAGIEAAAKSGNAPQEGVEEYEREEYTVRIETASYAFEIPKLEIDGSAPTSTLDRDLPDVPLTDLLAGAGQLGPGPLRSIHVVISWPDGFDERSVIRDTYAFDLQSVKSELAELEGVGAEAEPGDEAGDATPSADNAEDAATLREFGEALRRGAEQ